MFARVPKRLWGGSYKTVAVCSTHTSRIPTEQDIQLPGDSCKILVQRRLKL